MNTEDLPGGVPEGEMKAPKDHVVGQIMREDENFSS